MFQVTQQKNIIILTNAELTQVLFLLSEVWYYLGLGLRIILTNAELPQVLFLLSEVWYWPRPRITDYILLGGRIRLPVPVPACEGIVSDT